MCRSFFWTIVDWIYNTLITKQPFCIVRYVYLRVFSKAMGDCVSVMTGTTFIGVRNMSFASNIQIGSNCRLDARGEISIGSNVCISSGCTFVTADHDVQSFDFSGRLGKITIGDHVWIAMNCTILKGVTIENGAVVAAMSLVNKDVRELDVVGGVPAKELARRNSDLAYKIGPAYNWY